MYYTVDNLGVDTYHSNTFSHERPQGFPLWVFLHVLTPQYANVGSEMVLAEAGTCIIYPPGYPRYLYCPKELDGLRNDWIHFSCQNDDKSFETALKERGIPIGEFFTLRQTSTIISTLQDIVYEFSLTLPQRERMINSLIDILFIKIGRNVILCNEQIDHRALFHLHAFEQLRVRLYTSPQEEWTIASMAGSVYLGHNQFITLYSSFFGVTPKKDIINARISKAKTLLGNSSIMHDIAIACGYKNEFYFSTAFKRYTGITPSQYARMLSDRKYGASPSPAETEHT